MPLWADKPPMHVMVPVDATIRDTAGSIPQMLEQQNTARTKRKDAKKGQNLPRLHHLKRVSVAFAFWATSNGIQSGLQ